MALGLSADKSAIKRFVKKSKPTLFFKQCDKDGTALTTGDGTIWVIGGITKGTKFDVITSDYMDTDDTGSRVVDEETVEAYEITTTFMQRDKATRELTLNADGAFYLVAMCGQTIGTETESHVFGPCRIRRKFSYTIGENAQVEGITITTLNNPSSIAVTLPTEIGTGTITIPAGQMWATDDI